MKKKMMLIVTLLMVALFATCTPACSLEQDAPIDVTIDRYTHVYTNVTLRGLQSLVKVNFDSLTATVVHDSKEPMEIGDVESVEILNNVCTIKFAQTGECSFPFDIDVIDFVNVD